MRDLVNILSKQLQDSTKVIKTQQAQITALKQKLQKYKACSVPQNESESGKTEQATSSSAIKTISKQTNEAHQKTINDLTQQLSQREQQHAQATAALELKHKEALATALKQQSTTQDKACADLAAKLARQESEAAEKLQRAKVQH